MTNYHPKDGHFQSLRAAIEGRPEREPDCFCPQCGEPTPDLHEGYCEPCRDANQNALDLHNAEHDRWQGMTDKQRTDEIKRASR